MKGMGGGGREVKEKREEGKGKVVRGERRDALSLYFTENEPA